MKATRICDVSDCERPAPTRYQCEMHYSRMRTRGSYDQPPPRAKINVGPCAADGCDAKSKTQGFCGRHWERVRRHGDATTLLVVHDGLERFMSYVEKTDGCWLWRGTLTWDGYGLFRNLGSRTGAHRHAYQFLVGPIPEGLQLDHLCRVRNCVNPAHLEPVTAAENTRRAAAALGPACRRGHTNVVIREGRARYCPDCRHEQHIRRKAAS
jgi:hypothetical protein